MNGPFPTLVRCEELGLSPDYRGKVREIFELGDTLLLVATDRISAFDVIMNDPVPGRGALLTQMTLAWYDYFGNSLKHHLIHGNAEDLPEPFRRHADRLRGRVMLVRRAKPPELEAVVRGYLAGSGLRDYQASGAVCGHQLPAGMGNSEKFPEPLFTPATKAKSGHDENIDETRARKILGERGFEEVREKSLWIYGQASRMAKEHGIIIADTKFEFGLVEGEWILVDELLTPDSSRYWDAQRYQPGSEQDSMDKQILRNHLATLDWDKSYPPPKLDSAILERTYEVYLEIFRRLFPERARECGA